MYCPKCGTENADDAVFCTKCGNRLKTELSQITEKNIDVEEQQLKQKIMGTLIGMAFSFAIFLFAL